LHSCFQCFDAEWWGAGMVICLERGADLHMAQLMPRPLTVSCFSKIQIGFTFLVPAHLGSPGKGPLNWCVHCCMYVLPCAYQINNNNNKSVCFVHVFKMQKPRRRTILMRGWIFSCRGRSWLSWERSFLHRSVWVILLISDVVGCHQPGKHGKVQKFESGEGKVREFSVHLRVATPDMFSSCTVLRYCSCY